MSGLLVAMVGGSGVGKDSLIRFARDHLGAEVRFARRIITREVDERSEDHDSLTPEQFEQAEQDGAFALTWTAHGLRYGLPIKMDEELERGLVVVANVSRSIIPALQQRYPRSVVVCVTADRSILAERLRQRGRESPAEIKKRLDRLSAEPLPPGAITMDNSGEISLAGSRFVKLLINYAELSKAEEGNLV